MEGILRMQDVAEIRNSLGIAPKTTHAADRTSNEANAQRFIKIQIQQLFYKNTQLNYCSSSRQHLAATTSPHKNTLEFNLKYFWKNIPQIIYLYLAQKIFIAHAYHRIRTKIGTSTMGGECGMAGVATATLTSKLVWRPAIFKQK